MPRGSGGVVVKNFDKTGYSLTTVYNSALFTPTLTDAAASGDTTIVSAVVPGGQWLDGEVVRMRIFGLRKNDTGIGQTTVVKANATGGVAVTLASESVAGSAVELKFGAYVDFFRGGNIIYIPKAMYSDPATVPGSNDVGLGLYPRLIVYPNTIQTDGSFFTSGWEEITPTNFTSDVTLSLIINLAATNATYYVKPKHVAVYKQRDWTF